MISAQNVLLQPAVVILLYRYDWSPGSLADGIHDASLAQNSLYVPMIWGEGDLTEGRLKDLDWVGGSSPYLLGFNEPNYGHQVPGKRRKAFDNLHHSDTM